MGSLRERDRRPRRGRSKSAGILREAPTTEQPRERLLRFGPEGLSDAELFAVLLRCGSPGVSVLEVAWNVLREIGGLSGLVTANGNLLRQRGVGKAKVATILAALEISKRLARAEIVDQRLFSRPDEVARYIHLRYSRADQEVMGALYLNVRQRLIAEQEIFRGTLERAAVEPRAILKEALLSRASSFILFHSHPSGDPTPSHEDLAFTRRVASAAEIVGIRLLDHLVIGNGGQWVSLKRRRVW